MKRGLTRTSEYYYFVDGDCISGAPPSITGDLSGIRGDLSGITGDLSGIRGDTDECCISDSERENGVNVNDLIEA